MILWLAKYLGWLSPKSIVDRGTASAAKARIRSTFAAPLPHTATPATDLMNERSMATALTDELGTAQHRRQARVPVPPPRGAPAPRELAAAPMHSARGTGLVTAEIDPSVKRRS